MALRRMVGVALFACGIGCGGSGDEGGGGGPAATAAGWVPLAPGGTPPSPRWGHSAIFDPVRHWMIVFGGTDSADGALVNPVNDVWRLDLSVEPPAWAPLAPTGTPPAPRHGHCAVWDGTRMIVFGGRRPLGNGGQTLYNDAWALDLSVTPPEWDPLSPAGTPPDERFGHAGHLDVPNQRLIVFGGANGLGSPVFNDVWTLSLSGGPPTWTPLTPSGGPPSNRYLAATAFDGAAQSLQVFGGFTSSGLSNDAWTLSLSPVPAWSPTALTGLPPTSRYGAYAAVDAATGRLLLFGGATAPGGPTVNELWTLHAASTPGWAQPSVGGTAPGPRYVGSTVFDEAGRRMILYGGTTAPFNAAASLGEVWELGL
jgi:hypothetical protein